LSPILTADVCGFLATFVRAAALMQTAPVIGEKAVPAKVRVAAAAATALAVYSVRGPIDPQALPMILPAELALGLLAGLSARMIIAGAEVGGQLLGLQLGIGFAGQYDPSLGEESLPTRRIVAAFASLAFLALGGLDAVVRILAAPPPGGRTIAALGADLILRSGEVLVVAVRIAAPLLLTAVIVNLATGLASRAAPAINVFSVSFAVVLAVSGLVLVATAPILMSEVVATAGRAVELLVRVGR
jgi:flagellar biosynthesis protein FliR